MGKETERRFLVKSDEWRDASGTGTQYLQGYLSTDPKRNVRIRLSETKATLTIKGESKGISRPEFEYPIPLSEGLALQDLCLRPIIEKTRYEVNQDGLTWEIDVYAGENKGLIVAEVETTTEAPLPNLPPWIGREISGDTRYRNIDLVESPYSTWGQKPPTFRPKYHLKSGEAIPAGFQRIAQEQLQTAIDSLSSTGPRETAVHEARKCLKKTRSLVRLMRPAIGQSYAKRNNRLGSIGRKLSEVRDAQALIETVQQLRTRLAGSEGGQGKAEVASEIRDILSSLNARKEAIDRALDNSGLLEGAVKELEQEITAFERLPFKSVKLGDVKAAFDSTYRRGRKAFRNAYAKETAEAFHDLRKRVKDLRYQLTVIGPFWPQVLDGYAAAAEELEEYLGEDHNLAVLDALLDQQTPKVRISMLRSKLRAQQTELRQQAYKVAAKLYSEPADAWTKRLASSWEAWSEEKKKQVKKKASTGKAAAIA